MAQSLKDGEIFDLTKFTPVLKESQETDEKKKAIQQAGYDMMHQAQCNRFVEHTENLEQGLKRAYALIFSNYCSRTMQLRVEELPDFDTKIENDPIALLEVIKVLMHDPIRAQYPKISMTESLARLVNCKQAENEQLVDYVKRFKQLRDVAVSHLGTDLLNKFAEYQEEYKAIKDTDTEKAKKQKECKDSAFESWMAYLVIRGSDQSKYGTLTRHFVSQYALGNDQYPRTILKAVDVLTNHKFDQKFNDNQKRNKEKQQGGDGDTPAATSFAQKKEKDKDVICFICGKPGHRLPQCPDKDNIPKNKWAINKLAGMQTKGDDDADDVSEVSDDESVKSQAMTRKTRDGVDIKPIR